MVSFEDIKVGTFLHWFNDNEEFYGIFSNYSPACRKCSFFITYEVNKEQLDRSVLIYIPENMMSDVSIVDKEHRFKFINALNKSGNYKGFIERLRANGYIYNNDELINVNAKDEYGFGDWIINDLGTVCYKLDEFKKNIQRYLETSYRVVYDIDGRQHRLYTAMINKFFHLWSLIDAKPGDVLVHGDYIFVFKDFDNNTNTIKAKCCCNLYIGYPVVCKETEIQYNTNQVCFPADSSQRELLFDSLLIHGYEYNKATGSIRKIRVKK